MEEIYDYDTADHIDPEMLIFYENDYIEVSEVIDSGDSIMVKGYSHVTGDNVVYILPADKQVGLWTAA